MAAALNTPWPIHRFAELDSTSSEARRRADAGNIDPVWIQTQVQTAGRGRLGRDWRSPNGNLFATALFPFPGRLNEAALTCYAAGLAVLDAAAAAYGITGALSLKWPNDVMYNDAKVAGILIETGTVAGALWMAAGFGINVSEAPENLGRKTACLAEMLPPPPPEVESLLLALDVSFRSRLMTLASGDFDRIRSDWLSHAAGLGRMVELAPPVGPLSGIMRDLDNEGSLVIELQSGEFRRIRTGEVSIVSPPAQG